MEANESNAPDSLMSRAVGAVLGSAVGDALGAPYEFGPAMSDEIVPEYGPGKCGQVPGEWTDDTAMAIPILEAIAADKRHGELDATQHVVDRWYLWFADDGRGIGMQISSVMSSARLEQGSMTDGQQVPTDLLTEVSQDQHTQSGRSGGNGALMRTGPLALGFLGDNEEPQLVATAGQLAQLTHWENDNADACAIWSLAIKHAIRTGELDVAGQVQWIPTERQERWIELVEQASRPGAHPRDFRADDEGRQNFWVVLAFQGALAAVAGATDYRDAVERAVRGGGDTDTVAAIAGGLAGAVYGYEAIPNDLIEPLHGWPDMRAADLVALAEAAINKA